MKDPPKLRYRVVPRNGDHAVLSRDLNGTPEVIWPVNCASEPTEAEAYLFELASDCNSNCVLDSTDIANTPSLDVSPMDGVPDSCQNGGCHACDYENDDMLDLLDLLAFTSDWSANLGQSVTPGTNGDVNSDGAVDLLDLLAFLSCWTANLGVPCPS